MSLLELHPEELLEKEAMGQLSSEEREKLEEHAVRCSACRLERVARLDFQRDMSGEGIPSGVDDLVTRALAGAATKRAPIRKAPHRKMVVLGAIAAAMSLASVAAARWTSVFHFAMPAASEAPLAPLAPAVVPSVRQSNSKVVEASPSAEASSLVEAPRELPSAVPTVAVAQPKAGMAGVLRPLTTAQGPRDLHPESTGLGLGKSPEIQGSPIADVRPQLAVNPESPKAPEPVPVLDATALFRGANQARARGDHAGAIRMTRDLVEKYPSSPEATLSHATLGRMLLDDGRAEEALRELGAYLASGNLTLREEAMMAKATAYGRLGKASDEVVAWKSLLRSYPESMYRTRAESRLSQLESQ